MGDRAGLEGSEVHLFEGGRVHFAGGQNIQIDFGRGRMFLFFAADPAGGHDGFLFRLAQGQRRIGRRGPGIPRGLEMQLQNMLQFVFGQFLLALLDQLIHPYIWDIQSHRNDQKDGRGKSDLTFCCQRKRESIPFCHTYNSGAIVPFRAAECKSVSGRYARYRLFFANRAFPGGAPFVGRWDFRLRLEYFFPQRSTPQRFQQGKHYFLAGRLLVVQQRHLQLFFLPPFGNV
ncbi:MAG: hypothetical protein BWY71_01913 [Planctomycetes bacterium ADurb.Bin412]|nr:MAG: hypothetical protein BWY71_01913 [Planctomycetes bacterium ADurb.Bin412]